MRVQRAFLPILLVAVCSAQTGPTVTGNKNQTAGTNNGTMNQYNVTNIVKPAVKTRLKAAAKSDVGDDKNWARVLLPAKDADPPMGCPIDPGSLKVMLGYTNISACTEPVCKILEDSNRQAAHRDLLSVKRKGKSLLVDAAVFGEDGKIVVALDDSHPYLNPTAAFYPKRPDDSTLEVFDQRYRRVLYIRFVNPTTLLVEGLFANSTGQSLLVTDAGALLRSPGNPAGNLYSGNCATDMLGPGYGGPALSF